MLRTYQIHRGHVFEGEGGDSPVHVYVSPDAGERKYLSNVLKMDEHTLTSALDPDELSRLEFEPDHVALIFKRPKHYDAADGFVFSVASTGAFLFKDRVVIVIDEDVPLFDGRHFSKVSSPSDLVLRLIYGSIFHFLGHLKVINTVSESLEDKISESMQNKYLLNLFSLEKSLVYFLNAINSNGVLLERLRANSVKIGFTPEETELLEDILIENSQCCRLADIYSNILASLMDARVSIVSNNLNVLMKTLNIITIGIMVPTLVVSAFSMNVRIPISGHPEAFWIILGLAGVSVGGFLAFWRHKKW